MGKQFKQPFPSPDEPARSPSSPAMPDQDTLVTPAANFPPALNLPAQAQQGQNGSRPSGRLFQGIDGTGQPGNQQALQPGNQLFHNQQGYGLLGQQSGMPGMPGNAFQAPPPVTPAGSANRIFVPQGRAEAVGSVQGNWNAAAGSFAPESAQAREREKSRVSKGKQAKKRRRVPIWARVVISMALFLIVVGSGGLIYYQIYFANTINSITGKQFVRSRGEGDPNQGLPSDVLNWGRINILLLGSDTDEKPGVWVGNSYLAQTVIVASINTSTHEVDMLSIPRDFYLNIPGHGLDKLDTAFAYGGSINNNMSGVTEVVATLDQDFGIKINFYAWVGLQGFIKVINTVNGVDVNVMHPIVDDSYPDDISTSGTNKAGFGYKRVYIGDGPQHLDGPTALEYVRSRHSTTDFDRSARQQQVLSALRLKMDNVGIFGELPQIAQDLQGSLYTSLSTTQLLELGNFARGIDANKIKHLTLSAPEYGTNSKAMVHGQSQDVVIPNCSTVPGEINTFLHTTTALCNITASPGGPTQLLASVPGSGSGGRIAASYQASTSGLANSGQFLGSTLPSLSNLFGVRGLLDLMSMIVLDSPQA
ncbi:MAG TPA: LCP family protein [Ktedonobacteraceae bacterium]